MKRLQISIQVRNVSPEKLEADVLILPVFAKKDLPSPTKEINRLLGGFLVSRMERDHFDGESEKTLWVEVTGLRASRVLLVGLGKRNECNGASVRNGYGAAYSALARQKIKWAALPLSNDSKLKAESEAALEGFLLSSYRFDKYLKNADDKYMMEGIEVGLSGSAAGFQKNLPRIGAVVEATFLARDLVNEPANVVTPESMEQKAREIAKTNKLQLKVLHENDLKKLGMNLILAVGMGSSIRPRLVHLEYRPKGKAKKHVALVGKGVTFDSGGLSLKPQNNMYGMKGDMAGSAAVLATMKAISELKLPIHVHGIFPLVENVPSAHSVKPGDVFIAKNGKSVEIENTDAEGRLILADSLTYAENLKVDQILDLATLTGAIVVALGEDIGGMFTADDKLAREILSASESSGEKFWRLPLETEYKKLLKSDVADMKNVGGKYGGSITAALFLSEFVEKTPWAHLDIAGPAFIEHDWSISRKGGTGFPIRMLVNFLS